MAGIYIHVPFCTQRCSYCDFYFVTTARSHAPYLSALQMEMAFVAQQYAELEKIETIYIGGGTPSLLSGDDVASIMGQIAEMFDTSSIEEVTFELNPEDPSEDYLRYLKHAGVTRLSVGVQSFFQSDLDFMNRSHSAAQASSIVNLTRRAGFEDISVDLIFGVPGQPEEYWAANLEKAVQSGVPHLSTYGLTIEERTPLFKQVQLGQVEPVDQDTAAEIFRFTVAYLEEAGYEHYEVSNFALPGHRSVHNGRYWKHNNYIGLGPSAHSFWWKGLPAYRWANIRNLRRYVGLLESRHQPTELKEALDLDTLANEYIMLCLRTSDGLDLANLEHRYGVDLYEERLDELAWLESEGFIHSIRNDQVRLTIDGMLLADIVTSKLIIG